MSSAVSSSSSSSSSRQQYSMSPCRKSSLFSTFLGLSMFTMVWNLWVTRRVSTFHPDALLGTTAAAAAGGSLGSVSTLGPYSNAQETAAQSKVSLSSLATTARNTDSAGSFSGGGGLFLRDNSIMSMPDDDPNVVLPTNHRRVPTHRACDGYDGILHIAMGDIGGAAGTIFFQFVIGQLLYAEKYNLKPWIHFNNVSWVVYDDQVHGGGNGPGVRLTSLGSINATDIERPGGHWRDRVPGAPEFFTITTNSTNPTLQQPFQPLTQHFSGTGVWGHYFSAVSDLVPGDKSCENKPYVTLSLKQITPGIHGFVDWAPRCWRYKYLPDYVTRPHIPWTEWLEPQRKLGHEVVQKYFRFRGHLQKAAVRANPRIAQQPPLECTLITAAFNTVEGRRQIASCRRRQQEIPRSLMLGLHIRHSDKAAGRRQVAVEEFLPFVNAFHHAGGERIYLATDSSKVLQEIQETWPEPIRAIMRSLGQEGQGQQKGGTTIVRSHNETAVFEIPNISHHQTNMEALTEILALSRCDLLVHGFSALSESSLWINPDLPRRSVNLEDPEHISPARFGTLVQMVRRQENEKFLPAPPRTDTWWITRPAQRPPVTHAACEGYDGILHIGSVAGAEAGPAFFTYILNQLIYAENHKLKPWVHLRESTSQLVYDSVVHGNTSVTLEMMKGMIVDKVKKPNTDPPTYLPGALRQQAAELQLHEYVMPGSGVWESYFKPVSDFTPGDASCRVKPLVSMPKNLVVALTMESPLSVRAWRYDRVPEQLWKPKDASWQEWSATARRRASEIVKKYYRVQPHIRRRVEQVNPQQPGEVCLAVHFRNGDKTGRYRSKIGSGEFASYMEAFVRAGGGPIYVATDSSRALQYAEKNFPEQVTGKIRTQGKLVARTIKEWPTHMIDDHHRINSETLVDILAMSKCQLLLHGHSTVSEAAVYFNPELIDSSVNLEDPDRMKVEAFEKLTQKMVKQANVTARTTANTIKNEENNDEALRPLVPATVQRMDNATVLSRHRQCRSNAIIYLAQKKHSSYGRDSYSSLLQSLDLLHKNYLSNASHLDNTDIFIFHTGDFEETDLDVLESRLGPAYRGSMRLVDLTNSPYWSLPKQHLRDNPKKEWYAYPLFSEGYRRMMHWFAIDIWDFFERWGAVSGCNYQYIMRLDEDSFIHSPIEYDVFDLMQSKDYVYGYRMCAYEMKVANSMWNIYAKRTPDFRPKRQLETKMCGFYNNFFVASLEFFRSASVVRFLRFIDRQGHIYRRRLGDLMIHSMVVYAFAEPQRIHRFLDFTYEHSTMDQTSGCLTWGGIQAGYLDGNATQTLDDFYHTKLLDHNCPGNATYLQEKDLSPSYAHVPAPYKGKVSLYTITAGDVELPAGKGIFSG